MSPGRAVFGVLVLSLGCAKPEARPPVPVASATVAPAPPPEPADDCTFQTVLVPGVPGSPGHLLPSDLNPNGASELAALMRQMQKDVGAARAGVLDGGTVGPMWPRHRKIRCSWPTAPADRTPAFDGLAATYLGQVRAFDHAPSAEAFNNVLTACRACHDNSCPGPVVVIEGLRLPGYDGGQTRANSSK